MGKPVSPHGFISYAADRSPTYLPLKSVSAKVYIVDVSARVILTQLYSNPTSINTGKCASAQYIFPVPAHGAVCAFTMQTTDGRIVKGIVKERATAEREFEYAILQNTFAGLVYEATPDIFVITMGAIPAAQDVQVTIMYVTPLTDSDLPGYDQVEFTLPTYITTRYGPPPSSLPPPSIHPRAQPLASHASRSATEHTTLDINVHVQMPSEILEVVSCSHAIVVSETTLGPRPSPHSPRVHAVNVTLDPTAPAPRLTRAFVLGVRAAQLGSVPRCVAEVVRYHAGGDNTTTTTTSVALALTFVPRLKLRAPVSALVPDKNPSSSPHTHTHEYIFLIDRSGSMSGARIAHAKEALMLLVKSLPPSTQSREGAQGTRTATNTTMRTKTRTSFNIFGFGSTCVGLWDTSRAYDEASVGVALEHIKNIDADLGGTEIEHAIRAVLHSRARGNTSSASSSSPTVPSMSTSTSVFILTDGEVYDVDPILALVSSSVSSSSSSQSQSQTHSSAQSNPNLRFFTLGIGADASTALCAGVARAGQGVCLMSADDGDIARKCGRLLSAAAAVSAGAVSAVGGGPAKGVGVGGVQSADYDEGVDGLGLDAEGEVEVDWGHRSGAGVVLLQAPSRVPALFPENRLTVYAIAHSTGTGMNMSIPEEVVLYRRVRAKPGEARVRMRVEVARVPVCVALDPLRVMSGGGASASTNVNSNASKGAVPPLIHTIAAHRVIQELEDPADAFTKMKIPVNARREEIVRLSERYQLASRYASFVAVEGRLGAGAGEGATKWEEERKDVQRTEERRNARFEEESEDEGGEEEEEDEDDFYLDAEEEDAHARVRASTSVSASAANADAKDRRRTAGPVGGRASNNANANANLVSNTDPGASPTSIGGLYPKTGTPSGVGVVPVQRNNGRPSISSCVDVNASGRPRNTAASNTHASLGPLASASTARAPALTNAIPKSPDRIPNTNLNRPPTPNPNPIPTRNHTPIAKYNWNTVPAAPAVVQHTTTARDAGWGASMGGSSVPLVGWPGVVVASSSFSAGAGAVPPSVRVSQVVGDSDSEARPWGAGAGGTDNTRPSRCADDALMSAAKKAPALAVQSSMHATTRARTVSAGRFPLGGPAATSVVGHGLGTAHPPSHFVNAFKAPGLDRSRSAGGRLPTPTATTMTTTPTTDANPALPALNSKRSVYFLETLSTVDNAPERNETREEMEILTTRSTAAVENVSFSYGEERVGEAVVVLPEMRYPSVDEEVVYETDRYSPPSPPPPPPPPPPAVQVERSSDVGCHAWMRMPGAYPLGCCCCCCCCCCCRRVPTNHHVQHQQHEQQPINKAPEPRLRRSTTTLMPHPVREGPQPRPRSTMYELETATCRASVFEPLSASAVLGSLAEDSDVGSEDDEREWQPVFSPSATSKTGVYRAAGRKGVLGQAGEAAEAEWRTQAAPAIIDAAQMQRFDGSFALDSRVHALVVSARASKKSTLERLKRAVPVRLRECVGCDADADEVERVWATVLVAAYLKKTLPEEREVWIGLWEKAVGYVEGKVGKRPGMSFAALVLEASRLV